LKQRGSWRFETERELEIRNRGGAGDLSKRRIRRFETVEELEI